MDIKFFIFIFSFVTLVFCHNCVLKFKFARICHFYKFNENCIRGDKLFCKLIVTKKDQLKCPYYICPKSESLKNFNFSGDFVQKSLNATVLEQKQILLNVSANSSETINSVHSNAFLNNSNVPQINYFNNLNTTFQNVSLKSLTNNTKFEVSYSNKSNSENILLSLKNVSNLKSHSNQVQSEKIQNESKNSSNFKVSQFNKTDSESKNLKNVTNVEIYTKNNTKNNTNLEVRNNFFKNNSFLQVKNYETAIKLQKSLTKINAINNSYLETKPITDLKQFNSSFQSASPNQKQIIETKTEVNNSSKTNVSFLISGKNLSDVLGNKSKTFLNHSDSIINNKNSSVLRFKTVPVFVKNNTLEHKKEVLVKTNLFLPLKSTSVNRNHKTLLNANNSKIIRENILTTNKVDKFQSNLTKNFNLVKNFNFSYKNNWKKLDHVKTFTKRLEKERQKHNASINLKKYVYEKENQDRINWQELDKIANLTSVQNSIRKVAKHFTSSKLEHHPKMAINCTATKSCVLEYRELPIVSWKVFFV